MSSLAPTDTSRRPSFSQTWLDVTSAVDYLATGHRAGFTVWDAFEEAVRWWLAGHHGGGGHDTDARAPLPWDDPDPLRTGLEQLLAQLDTSGLPDTPSMSGVLHEALVFWMRQMAEEYNDGHAWTHPRDEGGVPTPLLTIARGGVSGESVNTC